MSVLTILLLFSSGFLTGLVNAVAGGGTFLTFATLTLAGLPAIIANTTSSFVQFPGNVTSSLAYRDEIMKNGRSYIGLALVSALGSAAGALLLLSLSDPHFRALVPWLLLAATAIFAAGPWLKPKAGERPPNGKAGTIGQFLVSIYGGFFGAGMGIMMLAALGLITGGAYHRMNALKNFLSVIISAVAILVFMAKGAVSWPHAAALIPGSALGGYVGVWAARKMPQAILRLIVVSVGLALALYYFWTG
jgi:uncharacterized membrane protein YfcA